MQRRLFSGQYLMGEGGGGEEMLATARAQFQGSIFQTLSARIFAYKGEYVKLISKHLWGSLIVCIPENAPQSLLREGQTKA